MVQGSLTIGGHDGRNGRYISREEEEDHSVAKKKAEHCQNMTVYAIISVIFNLKIFNSKDEALT